MNNPQALPQSLRMMDIMLIDQLFRGRIKPDARIADIGAGGGRNIRWFADQGHEVSATELNQDYLKQLPASVNKHTAALPDTGLENAAFDFVIVNAVLHFAPNAEAFKSWFSGSVAPLAENGILFIRCASQIAWPGALPCDDTGMVTQVGCHFSFLPSRALLIQLIEQHGLSLIDPIKTSVVDQQRCMSTIVLQKT